MKRRNFLKGAAALPVVASVSAESAPKKFIVPKQLQFTPQATKCLPLHLGYRLHSGGRISGVGMSVI